MTMLMHVKTHFCQCIRKKKGADDSVLMERILKDGLSQNCFNCFKNESSH